MRKGVQLLSPFGLAQIVTIVLIGVALWLAYNPWRWGQLREETRARFPTVPRITADELSSWLTRPEQQPVILDARPEIDYTFSHLPGARRANLTPIQLGLEGKLTAPIVVYCAVGFDSPPIALRYLAQGYTRVQFLEGGIFQWANEGRPLENLRGPTQKVYPGTSPYASYLDRSRRAVSISDQ